jgi:hypothetical protein
MVFIKFSPYVAIIKLLEERLLRGDISEEMYKQLKKEYEISRSTTSIPQPKPLQYPSTKTRYYKCGNVWEVTSTKRPLEVKCSKCGTIGVLK